MRNALLIYAAGETDANLYYATRFSTPDPVIFLRAGGRKTLVLSDIEVGRGRREARVDEVLSLSGWIRGGDTARAIARLLRDRGAARVTVPHDFPLELADRLRRFRIRVTAKPAPFFEERAVKAPGEIRAIEEVQRAAEEAMEAVAEILRRSKIRGHKVVHGGRVVTSESLRRVIDAALLVRDCVARDTIVAPGDQGCDPHCRGSGPVLPDRTLVVDIFPRSRRTRYCADMTRTFVKGRASPAARRLYGAVREAQEAAFAAIRGGVAGRSVHDRVKKVFEKLGYRTEPRGGKMAGFFHGTGHGVGLDVHEAPWISVRKSVLRAGAVVTVEPGLYYPGTGGVRLEDMVVVTRRGCRNLTRFPKRFEV